VGTGSKQDTIYAWKAKYSRPDVNEEQRFKADRGSELATEEAGGGSEFGQGDAEIGQRKERFDFAGLRCFFEHFLFRKR
jgi:hypothetical protein